MNPRLLAPILLMLLSQCLVFAVSPLVTDDAETVDPGHLQLNAGWQLTRTGSASLYSIPPNPILGLNSRGELGAIFGYQWRDHRIEANDITDLTIATKWRLWHTEDNNFKVSARFDLKVPTVRSIAAWARPKQTRASS